MTSSTTQSATGHPRGKILRGVVVSSKAKDTARVLITRFVKHPKYKKYRTVSKHYLAHDPGNSAKEGDTVTIRECRPLSKRKHFEVVE